MLRPAQRDRGGVSRGAGLSRVSVRVKAAASCGSTLVWLRGVENGGAVDRVRAERAIEALDDIGVLYTRLALHVVDGEGLLCPIHRKLGGGGHCLRLGAGIGRHTDPAGRLVTRRTVAAAGGDGDAAAAHGDVELFVCPRKEPGDIPNVKVGAAPNSICRAGVEHAIYPDFIALMGGGQARVPPSVGGTGAVGAAMGAFALVLFSSSLLALLR